MDDNTQPTEEQPVATGDNSATSGETTSMNQTEDSANPAVQAAQVLNPAPSPQASQVQQDQQGQGQNQPNPNANPNNGSNGSKVPPVGPNYDPRTNPADPRHKASWLYDVAQTLSGGPQYKYDVDVNTGKMTKTPIPVSGKHLGLAVALEALSGGLTGLAAGRGRGPGAAGAAALAQSEQRQKQQVAQQQQQASADYARQAAIAQTNMRMAMNERTLALADMNLHQKDVDSYSSLYDEAQKEGAVDKTGLSEDDVQKLLQDGSLHVTKDMLIPIRVRDKMNTDGAHVKGPNGEPLFEKEYALLKPSAQLTLPDDVKKILQENKVPGYVDSDGNPIDLPSSYEPRLHLIVDGIEKARTIQNGEAVLKGLSQKLVNPLHPAAGVMPTASKTPVITDPKLADTLDTAAKANGVDPAIVRAIAKQESNGNPNAVSPKGAKGVMQLIDSTAKDQGLSGNDVFDTEKNVNAGTKYFKQLLDQYKGNVPEALSAYNAGPGKVPVGGGVPNIPETQNYVKNIMASIGGTNASTNASTEEKPVITSGQIHDMMQGLTDKQRSLLTQWQLFYDGGPDKASTMDKLTEPGANGQPPKYNPQDVGTVKNLLNQVYPIDQYHDDVAQRKSDMQAAKSEEINAAKTKSDLAQQQQVSDYLLPPDNWKFDPNVDILHMDPVASRQYLESKGVKVPPNLEAYKAIASYGAPLSSVAQKLYKGVATLSQQDATSYIRTFLNPQFDETKYAAAQKFRNDLTPGGKVGQSMLSAGVASNHLDLAEQALNNLNNRQLPVWNKIANAFGTHITGAKNPVVYAAIADVLANEVGKVVSGSGQNHVEELKRLHDNLATSQSPEQAKGVLDAYVQLMNGRVNEVNEQSKDYFNEDIHVSPQVAKVFGTRGLYVPGYGDPRINQKTGQLGFTKDGGKTITILQGQ